MNKVEKYMKTIRSVGLLLSMAFFVIAISSFASLAHAQDAGDNGDCCGDTSSYAGSTYDTPTYAGSTYDNTPAPSYVGSTYDTPTYVGSTYDTPQSSTDYSYPSDSTDYSYPSGSSSGYSSPSYSYPSYSTPSYSYPTYSYPASSAPTYTAPSNSNTYAPTNTTTTITDNGNSCTAGNSCNTTYNGGNTTITTTTPAPVIDNNNVIASTPAPVQTVYQQVPVYTSQPVYTPTYSAPVCNTCSCNSAYCPQTVAYNNPATPYISLTAVPYTGLDLGPAGEVIYWSLLILMCLVGAYLIAVKRVQNTMAAWLKAFLLGEKESAKTDVSETSTSMSHAYVAPIRSSHMIPAPTSGVDDFIMAQVHRGARA
jgi:hypothetical protein